MPKLDILPSKKVFIEDTKRGIVRPISLRLPFMNPQHVYESISSPFSILLESIKGPEKIARYSICASEPFLILRIKDGQVAIGNDKDKEMVTSNHPLRILRRLMGNYSINPPPELPPFIGGAIGLISYDFVHYLERLPRTTIDDLNIPDMHLLFVDTVIVTDHKYGYTFIISSPGASERLSGNEDIDWNICYERSCEKIDRLYKKLLNPPPHRRIQDVKITIRHEMSKGAYVDMVKRAKEYIRAGDIFQANLSQRVSAEIGNKSPWEIYKVLSKINPAPFSAYMDMGEYHIVSSSPERLVRLNSGIVETRPIAGTRPRGIDAEMDRMMRKELLLNEKERAEHIMLIDLERNDLGKICDYGSIMVDEFMITEDYSHVIHIVSNIKGELAQGRDCFDVIKAVFPGGTITGVPKVRCMEIIDELEPVARGPYTGSIGYISFSGTIDLNIIIRTFVIKDSTAYVHAGAGIVADSDPEREYYETLKKAEALIRTLEVIQKT